MLISILAPYAVSPLAARQSIAGPEARAHDAPAAHRVRPVAPEASHAEAAERRAQAYAEWTALLDQIRQDRVRERESKAIPIEFDPSAQEPYDPAADREREQELMALLDTSDSDSEAVLTGSDLSVTDSSDDEEDDAPAMPIADESGGSRSAADSDHHSAG